MQKGQHIGKIVVSIDVEEVKATVVTPTTTDVSFKNDAAYLLVGGLGGLGRAVANWMIEHGARNLVFLGRRAGQSAQDQSFFTELRSQGCAVTAVQGSISNPSDVERAVAAAPVPLKGVMNMSMVLRDQGFAKMTHDEWAAAVEPKVHGTWNLHNACLAAGVELDFFVMFSSISGVAGQRGQANYAGGNTFLDAFVQYRQSLGLAACAVDIGMMVDHGYVAENPALLERIQSQGLFGIRIPELLDALAAVMRAPPATAWDGSGAFVSPAQLVIGLRSLTPLSAPSNRVHWKHDRRMAVYANQSADDSGVSGSDVSSTSGALAAFVASAMADPTILSQPDTAAFIARQVAIDVSRSLQDIGLDSLVAIEMRSWWKGVFGFDISVLEMLGMGSVLALGERAVEGLLARVEAESGTSGGVGEDGVKKVDAVAFLETKMP
jgi:NADP-dependent 3-hydroxy acid dehydrogenase YdfG